MKTSLPYFLFGILLFLPLNLLNLETYQSAAFLSKTLIFTIYSIGFLCLFIWNVIKSKHYFLISSVDISLLFLFLFVLLNFIFKENSTFSLRFYDLINGTLFYIFLRLFLNNEEKILISILGISVVIFTNTLYGWGQYFDFFKSFHPKFPITGSFFNPAPFAGFIAVGSVLSLFFFIYRKRIFRYLCHRKEKRILTKILYYGNLLTIFLSIILLILLKSRASWLAFLVGLAFLLFKRYRSKFLFSANKFLFSLLAVCTIILCGLFFYSLRKNSADGRLLVWKISRNIVEDFSLTGVGFDKFKAHYMAYQAEYFSQEKYSEQEVWLSDNVVYAFNDFLQLLIEQGFIGFALLLILIFVIRRQGKSTVHFLGTSLLIPLAVFACFSYPLQVLPLKMLGVIGIVFCAFDNSEKIQIFPHKFLRMGIISGCVCLLFFQGKILYGLHTGYSLWKKAVDTYFLADFKESTSFFEKAYPHLKTDGEFLMHYGKALSLDQQFEKSNTILSEAQNYLNNTVIQITLGDNYKALKNYENAEKHYKIASCMTPNRLYPHYLLAKMYEEKGDLIKAKKQAEILLKMPVKVPSMAIFEMQEEMKIILEK